MKRFMKKSLSVFLSVLMALTSCVVGFTGLTLTASAKDLSTKPGETTSATVKLIVPEQIYLKPDALSFKDPVASQFQYYVNNTANGEPDTSNPASTTTGKIYITAPAGATLSVAAYSISSSGALTALSGSSVTIGGTALTGSNSVTASSTMNITAGQSPTLNAPTDGYYLLWKLAYTENGVSKNVFNMTYVYKPFVVPLSASATSKRGGNVFGKFHGVYSGVTTWLSGIHDIKNDEATATNGFSGNQKTSNYANDGVDEHRGMAVFSNPSGSGTKGGEAASSTYPTVSNDTNYQPQTWFAKNTGNTTNQWQPMMFASNTAAATGVANFWKAAENRNGGVFYDGSYQYSNPHYPNIAIKNGMYDQASRTGGTGDVYYTVREITKAAGIITIDTSRYSNLSQIPNLSVGFMNNDTEGSQGRIWYIADASVPGGVAGGSQRCNALYCYNDWNEDPIRRFNTDGEGALTRDWYSYSSIIAGQTNGSNGGWTKQPGNDSHAGVLYSGPWMANLLTDTSVTAIGDAGHSGTLYYKRNPAVTGTNVYDMYTRNVNDYTSRDRNEDYYNYYVKGTAYNQRKEYKNYAEASAVVNLKAYQFDKSTLRSTVKSAVELMGKLGITGINTSTGRFTSDYFEDDLTSYKLQLFSTKFMAAVKGLVTLDTRVGTSTLSDELTAAMNNLQTKVTFKANGNTFADGTTADKEQWKTGKIESEQISAPAMRMRTGYDFLGWDRNNAATSAQYPYNESTSSATVNRGYNDTFYAIFKAKQYNINFVVPSGVSQPAAQRVTFDAPVANCSKPDRPGYTFKGYYDAQHHYVFDENCVYQDGTWTTPNDITLTADWEANTYVLSFNTNGGPTIASQSLKFDTDTPANIGNQTRTGYDYKDVTYGNDTLFNGAGNWKGGKWLYPNDVAASVNWTPKTYTLTLVNGFQYGPNNTQGAMIPQTSARATFDAVPSVTVFPEKTGFRFMGYTDAAGTFYFDGNGAWMNPGGKTKWDVDSGMSLQAYYEAIPYNFTINYDSALEQNPTATTFTLGTTKVDPKNGVAPAKTGYTFNNYIDTNNNNAVFTFSGTFDSAKDVKVKATYTANPYNITVVRADSVRQTLANGANGNVIKYDSPVTLESISHVDPATYVVGYYLVQNPTDSDDMIINANGDFVYNGGVYNFDRNITVYEKVATVMVPVHFTVNGTSYDRQVAYGAPLAACEGGLPATPRVDIPGNDTYHSAFQEWRTFNGMTVATTTGVTSELSLTAFYSNERHNYAPVSPIVQATCTSTGTGTETCYDCGHVHDVTLEKTAHNYVEGPKTADYLKTAATCCDKAEYWSQCQSCNGNAKNNNNDLYTGDLSYTDVNGSYAAHTWSTDTQHKSADHRKKPATCGDTTAEYYSYCTVCHKYADERDAAGNTSLNEFYPVTEQVAHTFGSAAQAGVAPTVAYANNCQTLVDYWKVCSVCKQVSTTEIYTIAGNYGPHPWTINDDASHRKSFNNCTDNSVFYEYCPVENRWATDADTDAPLHTGSDAYTSVYGVDNTDQSLHKAVTEVPGTYVAPTTSAPGKEADKVCSCGAHWTGASIPMLHHVYDADQTPYISEQHKVHDANCVEGAVYYKYSSQDACYSDDAAHNPDYETVTIGNPNVHNHTNGLSGSANVSYAQSYAAQQVDCYQDGWDAGLYCTQCGKYDVNNMIHDAKPVTAKYNHTNPDGTTAIRHDAATTGDCQTVGYTAGDFCTLCNQYISGHDSTGLGDHVYDVYTPDPSVKAPEQVASCHTPAMYAKRCRVCQNAYNTNDLFPYGGYDSSNHQGGTENVAAYTAVNCLEHSYSSGVKCLGCGEFISGHDQGAVGPHSANLELRNVRQATCQQTGYSGDEWCPICNTQVSTGTESPMAHNIVIRNVQEASCTSPKTIYYWCSECHGEEHTETEGTPIPHLWDKQDDTKLRTPATCTAKATYWSYCSMCQEYATYYVNDDGSYVFQNDPSAYYEKDGFADHVEQTPATCKHRAICAVCGNPYGTLNMKNHEGPEVSRNDGVDATCTANGKTSSTYCKACSKTITPSTVIRAQHYDPDGDTICNICGEYTSAHKHVDVDGDGFCDNCVKATDVHKHVDENPHDTICDNCGQPTEEHTHTDADNNGYCDVCHQTTNPKTKDCSCICHLEFDSNHFVAVIGKVFYHIARLFWRLFRIRKVCECGRVHY